MSALKVVLTLDLHNDREKSKAMKAVSGIRGINSIAVDMKDKKLTVIGSVDPVDIVGKLRKQWHTKILLVAPEKDEKKKDGDKKDSNKYIMIDPYNHFRTPYYHVQSVQENPNGWVICQVY